MRPALAAALLALALTGCGQGQAQEERRLTVLAAASLTGTLTEIGEQFETIHPGVDVEFSFGSSTTLAQQAVDGAPGDVLVTADLEAMEVAADVVDTDNRVDHFVTNALVLVTPPDDPAAIASLADLARPGTVWVQCASSAPCGRVADAVLADAGVTAEPASEEVDVKAVLARVLEGEADAGLVYESDAVAAGDAVRRVDLPEAAAHPAAYSIGVLEESRDHELAVRFMQFVLGEEGQRVMGPAGFRTALSEAP